MTTKLNLTIEEDEAKFIKSYARKRKTSVSKITQEFYSTLKTKEAKNAKKKKEKSFVEKYAGIIKDLKIDNIENTRDEYLKEKYGL